ncbi:MAG: class I SAM-dependent methyltransferase, partial [Chloroflexota bacterium]|nr:class I SAM-dependent methyltransferase [Chloroflexota bacterium]
MSIDAERGRSFNAWADEYERYRPSYPDELFATIERRLELPDRPHVADLGAGTGRASLAMAAIGWRVTAIEPGRPMLEQLRGRASEDGLVVATVQASAEE